MRAGIYVRISQDRTGESGGVKRQEEDCRVLAQQLGWDVADVYQDNDVSASRRNIRRPAYERLWADVDSGRIEAVLAYHPKRLYRRLDTLEDLIDRVEAHGLTPIRTVAGGEIDLGTATGRAMARITAALAQLEVEESSERVRREKASAAAKGRPAGSRRPFGYDRSGNEINEEEASAYREAVAMVLNGASLKSIVRHWNGQGLKGSSGGDWTINSVRRVLMSPRYAGRRVHQGKDVARAAWPAIITKRDHERVMDLLSDPSRRKGQPGARYLLTGLLECGICAGRMSGRPNNGQPGYVCRRTDKVHLGVKASGIEEYVVRRASDLVLESPMSVADPATMAAPLLREREEIEARLEMLGASFAKGEISESAFRGADRELVHRLAQLDVELAETASAIPTRTFLRDLADPVDDEAFYRDPETRAWLETLFAKIVVLPASRPGRNSFDESRVELHLRRGVRDHRD